MQNFTAVRQPLYLAITIFFFISLKVIQFYKVQPNQFFDMRMLIANIRAFLNAVKYELIETYKY